MSTDRITVNLRIEVDVDKSEGAGRADVADLIAWHLDSADADPAHVDRLGLNVAAYRVATVELLPNKAERRRAAGR